MSDLQDNPIKAEKRKKLHALKEKGINPYPYSFDQNIHIEKLIQDYANLTAGEKKTETNFRRWNLHGFWRKRWSRELSACFL